jgi:hypothetical protein
LNTQFTGNESQEPHRPSASPKISGKDNTLLSSEAVVQLPSVVDDDDGGDGQGGGDDGEVDIQARARLRAHTALHYRKRVESDRVQNIRIAIRAAIVIQRAFRDYRHRHGPFRKQLRTGSARHDKRSVRIKTAGAGTRTQTPSLIMDVLSPRYHQSGVKQPDISDKMARSLNSFLTTPTIEVHERDQLATKQYEIAALVIQLWWRRYKLKKLGLDGELSNTNSAMGATNFARQNAILASRIYRPKTAVQTWSPARGGKSKDPMHQPPSIPRPPSAAVQSFNSALSVFGQARSDYYNLVGTRNGSADRSAKKRSASARAHQMRTMYGQYDLVRGMASPELEGRAKSGFRPKSAPLHSSHNQARHPAGFEKPGRLQRGGTLPELSQTTGNRSASDTALKRRQDDRKIWLGDSTTNDTRNARATFAQARISSAPSTKGGRTTSRARSGGFKKDEPSPRTSRRQLRQVTISTAQDYANRYLDMNMVVGDIGLIPSRPVRTRPAWNNSMANSSMATTGTDRRLARSSIGYPEQFSPASNVRV